NEFPSNAALYVNRGNLQLVFGFSQKAIQDYTRAIHLDRQYAEAYYNRGLSHLLLFDSVSACTDLEQSAELGYDRALEKIKYFCQ
ncbi:MAG: tetratricopeptide repeat protein, partial [Bacteroidota bacterium]